MATRQQQGFSPVVIIIVIVVIGILGFVGLTLMSAPKDKTADSVTVTPNLRQSESKPSGDNSSGSDSVKKITLSKAPQGLQKAVLAEYKASAPACVKDDKIIDPAGNAQDPEVSHLDSGFAQTVILCETGSTTLFAKTGSRSEGSWAKVGSTQLLYKCSDLRKYQVPDKFLRAVATDTEDVRCLPDDPNAAPVKYEDE